MKWTMAIGATLCLCATSFAQTNEPDYEYAPPSNPPTKPSPWLPYGVAGIPEQLLRLIFAPIEWTTRASDQRVGGIGTSPFTSEQPPRGMFPMLGYSPARGAGIGIGYYDENFHGPARLLRIEGEATTADYERLAASWGVPVSMGRLELGASFDRDANAEFSGFGNRTRESDLTYFEWIEGRGWVAWNQPLPAGLTADLGATFHALEFDSDGGEDSPRTRKRFALSTVPGFKTDPDLLELSVRLSHRFVFGPTNDVTAVSLRTQAAFSRFEAIAGGDDDFLTYSLGSTLTVPLGKPLRELRLGLRWEEAWADSHDRVPFVFQPSLGENTGLRGFARDRFHDRQATLTSVEYRFPAWAQAQAFCFFDAGRVSENVSLRSWQWSSGMGGEIETPSRFHMAITLGFSEEGVQPVFRMTRRF